MITLSRAPTYSTEMQTQSLRVEIVPGQFTATLIVNGRYYFLEYTEIASLERLRDILADEPEYVYNAVIEMLKEMAK